MGMLRSMLSGDPTPIIQNLQQTNPSFARFMAQCQGRDPREVFKAYGYDFDEVMRSIGT